MQGRGTKLGIRKRVVLAVLFLSFSFITLSVAALAQDQGPIDQPASPFDRAPEEEITSLRTDCSKSYANPDGSITAIISGGPIHYKDDLGVWQDIDTTLSAPTKEGYGYSVTKNAVKIHFAATADGWLCVEINGHSIEFAAQGASPKSVGVISGSTITYAEAWPGIDLRYTATGIGLKEDIILKEKPSVTDLLFTLRADSLKLDAEAGGSIAFIDASGKAAITIPVGFAQDADSRRLDGIRFSCRAQQDGSVALSVPVDAEWLSAASYPVVIDPTFYAYTWVYASYGQDQWVEEYPVLIGGGGGWTGCVSFDDALPPLNSRILSACMVLATYPGFYTGQSVQMKEITDDWPCDGPPSLGPTLSTVTWGPTQNTFYSLQMGSILQRWLGWLSTYHGFAFTSTSQDLAAFSAEYPSSYMIVNYIADTTAPSALITVQPPAYVQPGASVQFKWSATDGETPVNQVRYVLAAQEPNWNTVTPVVVEPPTGSPGTVGGTRSCTAPTSGGPYRVYFKAKSGYGWSAKVESGPITLDGEPPDVSITSPAVVESSSTDWHVPSSHPDIVIKGKALDGEDGSGFDPTDAAAITLTIDGGTPCNLNDVSHYNPITGVWNYTWSGYTVDQQYTITVNAYDRAGNLADEFSCIVVVREIAGGIIYVDQSRPDDTGNGQSWGEAKRTIEGGVARAAELISQQAATKVELWVAQGTYSPAYQIVLEPGVSLYGGYAGNETVREQRNWATYQTAVSLALAWSICTPYAVGEQVTIDGFVISNGVVGIDAPSASNISHNIIRNCNTGISCSAWLPTTQGRVVNNWITDCNVGMYLWELYDDAVVANNTITRNGADGIAAVWCSAAVVNNILAYNGGSGISGDSNYSYRLFSNNCVFGNAGGSYSSFQFSGSGNLYVDPLVQLGHIPDISPCRNAGLNGYSEDADARDIDAQLRKLEGVVDIGADEYDSDQHPDPIIIHVKLNGDNGLDGRTWANAVASVQKGVDLATELGHAEVWVAAGTYGRAAMASSVYAYGGFADGDTFEQRDWIAKATILDGGSSGSVVTADRDIGCRIDGFTIQHGTSTNGGGVYCIGGSVLLLAHNTIRYNTAGRGGGVYCLSSTSDMFDNMIRDNSAQYGGVPTSQQARRQSTRTASSATSRLP